MLLPRVLERACQRNEGNPGSTVNGQQNRVGYVLAAHFDPLIDAADVHSIQALDAARRANGAACDDPVLQPSAIQQCGRKPTCDDEGDSQCKVFDYLPNHALHGCREAGAQISDAEINSNPREHKRVRSPTLHFYRT